eukprot:XP_001708350.1 Hypothetical protein GL50803_18172 [Giardia lamblia ATCC 50803]
MAALFTIVTLQGVRMCLGFYRLITAYDCHSCKQILLMYLAPLCPESTEPCLCYHISQICTVKPIRRLYDPSEVHVLPKRKPLAVDLEYFVSACGIWKSYFYFHVASSRAH